MQIVASATFHFDRPVLDGAAMTTPRRGVFTTLCVLAVSGGLANTAAGAAGDPIASMPSPGDSASGLGWDGRHLWVANLMTATGGGTNRVSQHDPITFDELHGFDMQGSDVFHGMAFDADGNIWVDNFNKAAIVDTDIVKIDSNGNTLEVHPAQGTIYGVALSDDGRLFQVDNHSVEPGGNDMPSDLYNLDAETLAVLAGPIELSLNAARGVAFDGSALWVASNDSDSVYRVDVDTGLTLAQFTAPGEGGVEGLTWDGRCLWVSDTRGDVIYRVDHGQADLPECIPFPPPGEGGGEASATSSAASTGAGGTATGAGSSGAGGNLGDDTTSSDGSCQTAFGDPPIASWWILGLALLCRRRRDVTAA
jgi:hypothetical protein